MNEAKAENFESDSNEYVMVSENDSVENLKFLMENSMVEITSEDLMSSKIEAQTTPTEKIAIINENEVPNSEDLTSSSEKNETAAKAPKSNLNAEKISESIVEVEPKDSKNEHLVEAEKTCEIKHAISSENFEKNDSKSDHISEKNDTRSSETKQSVQDESPSELQVQNSREKSKEHFNDPSKEKNSQVNEEPDQSNEANIKENESIGPNEDKLNESVIDSVKDTDDNQSFGENVSEECNIESNEENSSKNSFSLINDENTNQPSNENFSEQSKIEPKVEHSSESLEGTMANENSSVKSTEENVADSDTCLITENASAPITTLPLSEYLVNERVVIPGDDEPEVTSVTRSDTNPEEIPEISGTLREGLVLENRMVRREKPAFQNFLDYLKNILQFVFSRLFPKG
mmetsp:Transcript_15513/g.23109  ORF Transcript_15513/g.23109 Transcript_15513/m.23109 type:complete len:404 (+) Transcript_15513:326-1537(+)|eukprot:CAMPEP_0171453294 /NCGR_PEP_ID=MMETSP0945-20130129/1062_1 /TAXON_ID=109269 /ORGANISM="Vaucheria litorea, Strain CCMP2940" /LENGTH=403 /DNA_ID=CAMNT_0011978137 /DNA_START=206 /DNA_END=1417 /DNA_ORIENTATION=-